jgi:hypothetical protein
MLSALLFCPVASENRISHAMPDIELADMI